MKPNLTLDWHPISDLVLSTHWSVQWFGGSSGRSTATYSPAAGTNRSDQFSSRDAYVEGVHGEFSLTYLSRGNFDSRIILDDYNKFYRRQYAKGQTYLHLNFWHSRDGKKMPWEVDRTALTFSAAYGFSDHLALSFFWRYRDAWSYS